MNQPTLSFVSSKALTDFVGQVAEHKKAAIVHNSQALSSHKAIVSSVKF